MICFETRLTRAFTWILNIASLEPNFDAKLEAMGVGYGGQRGGGTVPTDGKITVLSPCYNCTIVGSNPGSNPGTTTVL